MIYQRKYAISKWAGIATIIVMAGAMGVGGYFGAFAWHLGINPFQSLNFKIALITAGSTLVLGTALVVYSHLQNRRAQDLGSQWALEDLERLMTKASTENQDLVSCLSQEQYGYLLDKANNNACLARRLASARDLLVAHLTTVKPEAILACTRHIQPSLMGEFVSAIQRAKLSGTCFGKSAADKKPGTCVVCYTDDPPPDK